MLSQTTKMTMAFIAGLVFMGLVFGMAPAAHDGTLLASAASNTTGSTSTSTEGTETSTVPEGTTTIEVPSTSSTTAAKPGDVDNADPVTTTTGRSASSSASRGSVTTSFSSLDMARSILEGMNKERAERGVAPLQWDDALAQQARSWSLEMSKTNSLEHSTFNSSSDAGEKANIRASGENIYKSGRNVTAGAISHAWMQSAGHRKNMLQPGFDRVGIGVYCTSSGMVWATEDFGGTSSAPSMSNSQPAESPIVWSVDSGPSCTSK